MDEDTRKKRIAYLEEKLKENQSIIDATDKEIPDIKTKSEAAQKRYNHHKSQVVDINEELKKLKGNPDNE